MTTGDELRGLMRLWPHGVSILSVDVEGDRMGVTVSSLVSLSLEPPLIGVSIGKDASCYELLRSAGRFAISLLGSEQEELARRFAAGYPPIVHWQGVPTREGQVAPLIDGALGWIEAETLTEADAGDHTFFIADVLSIEHGPSHHALVYRESAYHSVWSRRASSTSTACCSSRRRSGTPCASATCASAVGGTTRRCSGR
jgi:flavin reductase (DIM6/NTAB) family NADH-FMN oxidoreductase RutF